jgi:hypothetical protein
LRRKRDKPPHYAIIPRSTRQGRGGFWAFDSPPLCANWELNECFHVEKL